MHLLANCSLELSSSHIQITVSSFCYRKAFPSPTHGMLLVAGKSLIWLHVGSVSFTLIFASHCFCSLKVYCLYINGLPRGTLPLCLNVKPKCLCSGKHLDPVQLWMAARKKKLTHPFPKAGHSRGYLQNLGPFYFTSSSLLPLCAIKETGIQTLIRWLFRDIGVLAFRIKSYSLPQHLVSDLLACRAASRASLDSVTFSLLGFLLFQYPAPFHFINIFPAIL